ncbi:MAG TPA: ABC transporter substrate-binding protein [Acidimicrobiia bacterium]|jgi:alpha-glucoside transport system substrate-binding protein
MRKLTMLVLVVAFAVVVAACAADGTETTTSPPGDTPTTAAGPTTTAGDGTTTAPPTTQPAPTGPYEYLGRAQAGEFAGATVEILSQWIDAEGENFEATIQPFIDATGIEVNFEGITDYETVLRTRIDGGNAPDLAQIAQPGLMQSLASEGRLVSLSDWFNVDQLSQDYIQSFIDLGSYENTLYGVYFKGDLKSIVWYPVQAFADAGYAIPTTWDELITLSDQIVADGNGNPWCVSMEHGDVTGWVATDWIEDVLLRTAPPETYDQWVRHEIPFDDPAVVNAANLVAEVWFADDYVFGGSTAINGTWVGDTQTPMFDAAGPKCWMHKQAAWIPEFWPEGTAAGVDSSFFYFPPIDPAYGSPVLGAGDMFVMFDDRPEVRATLEFLATAEGAQGWIENGGFVSPNLSVPLDWYSTYPNDELAVILAGASTLRFDASDTMPAEVGQGTFWAGMIEWVAANGAGTEDIFAEIEASWP